MNVLFDKTSDSKCPVDVNSNSIEDETDDCKHLKKALLESISTGKIGALTVDPQYLDFEALECKYCSIFKILYLTLSLQTKPVTQMKVP